MTNDITILSCPQCGFPRIRDCGNGLYQCDDCGTHFDKNENIVLTEQEYLQTCNTEQLAEFIYCLTEACDYYAGNGAKKISQYAKEDANDKNHIELIHGNRDFDELVEWLKQPHREE